MMRRTVLGLVLPLLLLGVAVMGVLLLVQTPARAVPLASSPDDLGDPVTIIYWHTYPGDREEFMQGLIDEFNATNAYNITVQGEYTGGYNETYEGVMLGLEGAGPLPNVVVAYPNAFADFARHGAVRFLDDYINDPILGIPDTADFYPGVLANYRLAQYGNQLSGIQYGRSIEVMYYNADMLAAENLALPETWEMFETACISLTSETVSGTIPTVNASRFANWLWSRGGQVLSEEGDSARFHEQPGIDSLLAFQRLIEDGYARLPNQSYEEQTAFGNGLVGFVFGSSTGIPYYRQSMDVGAGDAWGVTRVPAEPGNEVVDSYGAGAGVIAHSEDEDRAAWLFIRWLAEREQTARWAAMSGYFPVRISAETHISITQKLDEDEQYAQAFGLLPLGRSEPGVRGYEDVRAIIEGAMTEILANGANVTDTLQSAATEVDLFLSASAPKSTVIPPEGGTLVYTSTSEVSATVEFPPGSVDVTQTVSYVPLDDLPTDGLAFALVPNLTFSHPVTITLYYRDSDIAGMDENELELYLFDWGSGLWVAADPCGGYVRDPLNNILQAAVCHFSDYAMVDRPYAVHLPIIVRSSG